MSDHTKQLALEDRVGTPPVAYGWDVLDDARDPFENEMATDTDTEIGLLAEVDDDTDWDAEERYLRWVTSPSFARWHTPAGEYL